MIAQVALVAASVFEDVIRDGLRFAGAVVVALLVPVILVVVIVAMFIAAPFVALGGGGSGSGGGGGSQPPAVPPAHLAVMVQVGNDTSVPWALLAAIASVESGFGANMSTSWAGAMGYGQFMPPSWTAFGEGGDLYDYRDVIPAMARYLLAADVLHDIPGAVYAYNHSWEYVALVLGRMTYYTMTFGKAAATLGAPTATPRGIGAIP